MTEGTTYEVPPLSLLSILKEGSGEDLFSLSLPELRTRLRTGVILRDKKENTETQFFWMDEKSNLNCFMLLPKSLRISAGNGQVPSFVSDKETRARKETTLHRVKYENVILLKVGGKFWTMGLSGKGTEYEVVLFLKVMARAGIGGSYFSAKFLSLPDGRKTQNPWEFVGKESTGEWESIKVGTFRMTRDNIGELSFDLQFYFRDHPDILIKGVVIKPTSAGC